MTDISEFIRTAQLLGWKVDHDDVYEYRPSKKGPSYVGTAKVVGHVVLLRRGDAKVVIREADTIMSLARAYEEILK